MSEVLDVYLQYFDIKLPQESHFPRSEEREIVERHVPMINQRLMPFDPWMVLVEHTLR